MGQVILPVTFDFTGGARQDLGTLGSASDGPPGPRPGSGYSGLATLPITFLISSLRNPTFEIHLSHISCKKTSVSPLAGRKVIPPKSDALILGTCEYFLI